jgi:hypothetical protein
MGRFMFRCPETLEAVDTGITLRSLTGFSHYLTLRCSDSGKTHVLETLEAWIEEDESLDQVNGHDPGAKSAA